MLFYYSKDSTLDRKNKYGRAKIYYVPVHGKPKAGS